MDSSSIDNENYFCYILSIIVALLLSYFVNLVMRTNTLKKRKDFYQVQDITVSSVLFALQGVLPCPVEQGEAWNFLAVQGLQGEYLEQDRTPGQGRAEKTAL